MKKAIVIGAFGFIGFALCQRLLEEGFEVLGIDRYKSGEEKKMQEQKLLEVGRNSNFQLIAAHIEDVNLQKQTSNCDIVYYCLYDDTVNQDNVQLKMQESISKLEEVLDFCHSVRAQFVYLSSYEVFSSNERKLSDRTKLAPRNLNGIMKMEEEEQIVKSSQLDDSFHYLIFRLPTIYGPWQPNYMTYQQLINGSKSPTIDSIIEDAIYIYDLVDLLIQVSDRAIKKGIYLIGSNKESEWQSGFNLLFEKRNDQILPTKQLVTEIEASAFLKAFSHCLKTGIEQGISRQKEHHMYIQRLKLLDLL